MRLLLDAHVSGRVIAAHLRSGSHDVLALTEEPALGSLPDEAVLRLAAEQGRILVTNNVKDFAPLLREWAEAGRSHGGCVLIHGLDHSEYGRIIRGLDRLLADRPRQDHWVDVALFLTAAHP